jgi:hypothetical protein
MLSNMMRNFMANEIEPITSEVDETDRVADWI